MQNGRVTQASLRQFPAKIGLLFLMLLTLSNATCKSSLFKMYADRYLPNYMIKTLPVTSQFECSMACARQDACESWNLYEIALSGLTCELNSATTLLENSLLTREGTTFGRRLDIDFERATPEPSTEKSEETISYIFTTLGAEGPDGPTNTGGYQGTTLEGQVTLQNGIQEWTVPHTGIYQIESGGAGGANGTCTTANVTSTWQRGGLGTELSGKFSLSMGTRLKILVGQRGIMGTSFNDQPGGGGGGSFVTYRNDTPLIVAGGGGGGGGCNVVVGKSDGDPGQLGILGSRCNSTAGNGGMLCSNEDGFTFYTGAGAGLLSNGDNVRVGPETTATGFVQGGRGGTIHIGSNGGFGGGGYGWEYAGGGGGYTGGGVWANSATGNAGGGGSINHGFDRQSGYADVLDHGLVKIVFLG